MNIIIYLILLLSFELSWAENTALGETITEKTNCESGAFNSILKLCKIVDFLGSGCKITGNTCATSTTELFAGNTIELADKNKTKIWTGFGGLGLHYNAAPICLMKQIKELPNGKLQTEIKGDILPASTQTEIGIISFDPKKPYLQAYHRMKACGPIVGCLDIFTQKFTLTPDYFDTLTLGKSYKAGGYDITGAFSTKIWAEGLVQGFVTKMSSISVPTPIGPIDVTPELRMGRAIGSIISPFDGNKKSSSPSSFFPIDQNKTFDVYGKINGTNITSTYGPVDTAPDDYAYKFSQKAWMSVLAIGGRDPLLTNEVWKPAVSKEFPYRPDLNFSSARSEIEKIPNAYMGASANVTYDLLSKLPSYITDKLSCTGFVKLCIKEADIFAKPSIDIAFSSQFQFYQNEQAFWKETKPSKEFSLPILTPDTFDQYKTVKLSSTSTVASLLSLESGFNLRIRLTINGKFFKIDKNLINIHPRTIVPLKSDNPKPVTKTAEMYTLASQALKDSKVFQGYTDWKNTNFSPFVKDPGSEMIASCLKTSEIKTEEPSEPKFEKGNPEEFNDYLEQPCNICIAYDDIPYIDNDKKEQVEPGQVLVLFPAEQKDFNENQKWKCQHSSQIGCHDICDYSTGKPVVKFTAEQLIKIGYSEDMPKTCQFKPLNIKGGP